MRTHRRRTTGMVGMLLLAGCSSGEALPPEGAGAVSTGATGGLLGAGGMMSNGGSTSAGVGASPSTGGVSNVGGQAAAGNPSLGGAAGAPVDCSSITSAGYQLCAASEASCEAVSSAGVGCRAVCAAAGLACVEAFENVECAKDPAGKAVPCDSGNQSDYCVCRGTGGAGGAGGAGAGGAAGSTSGGMGTGGGGGSGGSGGGFPMLGELKAFPTAEGYGRKAKGGRGGRVMIVTNLDDSGPGSLREAVEATGARTVVFNIGGTIRLKSKLVIGKDNKDLTIAGQTAPGKGISVRDYTFGMIGGQDVIVRFVRTRIGTASGETMDGMGETSSNNTIFDHCSISWTIDEGFSSRGALNITLQRSLISECLNEAGHQKYPAGTRHGYAASINGDIGSFHHNLLAHCAGRNWSMAGGLKAANGMTTALGQLDLRNNVIYNFRDRTTDGEIYRVNFVNNYYKPGPASVIKVALVVEYYEGADNKPEYYIAGNVMPGVFGANDVSKSYSLRETPPNDFLKKSQLWEPYVNTQSAEDAYQDVLANVGSNRPSLDDHDARVIREAKEGTYTYKGSRTGFPGLIDNEADSGGHKALPVVQRPSDWDTDKDGMPNTWERAHGLDPNDPNDRNATTFSTVGYTNLEMYLNELAGDFE